MRHTINNMKVVITLITRYGNLFTVKINFKENFPE